MIGDIEMGQGDLMDDFKDDDLLENFIEKAATAEGSHETVLVLNGDVFDFLKMDYQGSYPRYITEEISLWKFEKIIAKHPKFLENLKKFLEYKHTRLIIVIGNHDADLAWPKVQEKIYDLIGNRSKITFTHAFEEENINIQHGNLIDPLFVFPHQKDIIEHKGKKILHLPFGSQVASQYLIDLKKQFAEAEKSYPQKEVLKKYPEYQKAINALLRKYLIKMLITDPLLHFRDPMYQPPLLLLAEQYIKNGFSGVHDEQFLNMRILRKKFKKKPLYILSHAHTTMDINNREHRTIVTDCWREEFDVSRNMAKKEKKYIEINLNDNEILDANLKQFNI